MDNYGVTSKKQTHYQRSIHGITIARKKVWLSLKRFGRQVVQKLVKWCLLPLAIAACFSMINATPAELPVDYYAIGEAVLIER